MEEKENNRKGTKYSVLGTLLMHNINCILKDGATRALSFENPVCQLNNLARPFTEAKNWGKIPFQDFVIKKKLDHFSTYIYSYCSYCTLT